MSLYVGVMSGTSMDSIDAVLTDVHDTGVTVIAQHAHGIPAQLHERLTRALNTDSLSALELWQLDAELGSLFADSVNTLLKRQGVDAKRVTAIGSHGQTLLHAPQARPAITVQIADPNVIALRTGIVTVADFRRMDVAAGGQGAPLAPAFHAFAFSHPQRVRAILNIGGIANLTILPPSSRHLTSEEIVGFDTGPGNTLMDAWILEHLGEAFDNAGQWAESGQVVSELLDDALADDYFSRPAPKSTGLEHFNRSWLVERLKHLGYLRSADVQRTLCELTARTAAQALLAYAPDCTELFICGGGALNKTLVAALGAHLTQCRIAATEELGVPAKSVEGAAFAWLAHQRLLARAAVSSNITGANSEVCLGGVYLPGPGPGPDSRH